MNGNADTRVMPGVYINGVWRMGEGTLRELVSPANERVIGRVADATVDDVDAAVAAARVALPTFANSTVNERAELLSALGRELRSARSELIDSVMGELGSPLRITENVHVDLPIRVVESMAELVQTVPFETRVRNSVVHRVPVGVVAAITPWNYPLHQIVAKLAAAFAAGCTVVLKPAELTAGTARLFIEATERAGFAPGVVNLLCGDGAKLGPALVEHDGVDMVSFTGSLAVGEQIGATAGARVKRITLELGGKSASLVLPDVDDDMLVKAIKVSAANCFLNSGQTCTAWTRLVVPQSKLDSSLEILRDVVAKNLDPSRLGPMVSAAHRERVLGFMTRAEDEGVTVVAGGATMPFPAEQGWYVTPTVYAHVNPQSEIAREEVFGPVMTVFTYPDDDLESGLALVNDSQYGLSGAVWAADQRLGELVASRVEAGQVDVNGASFNLEAPFGGFKKSGLGRELGRAGIDDYLDYRSVQLPQ